jgi:hypothetical protein
MQVRDHFRAHGRRVVSLPAILRDEARAVEEDARIKNLGLGGALVELAPLAKETPFVRVDATVILEVTAPSLWDPLILRCRVAWGRRSQADRAARLGVRFEHQEQTSLFALFQLLGAHAYEA